MTSEFVEQVRQSFAETDTDNTGYLDVSEFTVFMRRTYPDMSDREAQIIFMKVRISMQLQAILAFSSLNSDWYG